MRLGALVLPCLLNACVATPQRRISAVPSLALDDSAVKTRSHAFFDAWDRGDLSAFDEVTSPAFETFSHDRFVSKPMAIEILRRRADRHTPPRTRTWEHETVIVTITTAVFIG